MKPKNPFASEASESLEPSNNSESNLPAYTPRVKNVGQSESSEVTVVQVPAGSKAIIIRKEFSPAIIEKISELETELKTLGGIATQDDVVRINASLKKANTLIKTISAERLLLASTLKTEQDALIAMERAAYEDLKKLMESYDKKIVEFQAAEKEKENKRLAEIQRQKDEELRKITENNARISRIKNNILEFERNVLNRIHSSTIETIDSDIATLAAVKLNQATYEEFLHEAQVMYQNVTAKFQERKTELMRLADLEAKNKEAADKMRAEQQQKSEIEKEQQQQKAEIAKQEIAENLESDVANVQMASELQTSMIPKAKNVLTRYVFDEEKVDMSLLPEEYKTYDKAKIQEAINAGAREIPGLVIEQKLSNIKR
jgi:DNA repair exonuclease SbcCD ATPase subunit